MHERERKYSSEYHSETRLLINEHATTLHVTANSTYVVGLQHIMSMNNSKHKVNCLSAAAYTCRLYIIHGTET